MSRIEPPSCCPGAYAKRESFEKTVLAKEEEENHAAQAQKRREKRGRGTAKGEDIKNTRKKER